MGVFVVGGEGAHDGEAAESELAEAGLAAASDHDVGLSAADHVGGLADGLGAGGAGGDDGGVVTEQAELHGDVGGGHVGEDARDEERVEPHPAAVDEFARALFEFRVAAAAVAEHDADPAAVEGVEVERGVLDGLARGGDGELGEAGHAAGGLAVHEVLRVEVADFAADRAGEAFDIEEGDGLDAAFAVNGAPPEGVDAVAERRERAHAGDHDAAALVGHR